MKQNLAMNSSRSFLVRCWQEKSAAPTIAASWRFLVIEIGHESQAMRGFTDFEEMAAYLRAVLRGKTISKDSS